MHLAPIPLAASLSLLFAAGGVPAQTVTWDPLARPRAEADTLFLPDLTSPRSVQADGGFLMGNNHLTQRQLEQNFEFGPGKFGPAVRGKPGPGPFNFLMYPVDGLLPADEFTLEFWARWDRPWAALETGRPIFQVANGGNTESTNQRLSVMPLKGQLHVEVAVLEGEPAARLSRSWQRSCDDLNLTGNAWHHLGLTLKAGTLRVYVNGAEAGKLEGVRLLPAWSDAGHGSGILVGGTPGPASGFWVSDVRVCRTARVPGRAVKLRPLDGSLVIDAGKKAGALPSRLLGALHPGPTIRPEQTRAALHVIRTDKLLTATPMKRGTPDRQHPSAGRSGRFAYDWQVVDRSLDWLTAHGVVPYISIDSTPSLLGGRVKPFAGADLATKTSSASGFTGEPPRDLGDWAAVVEDLIHHVLREKKVVVPWWGVWNEPDLEGFWTAGLERYLDLYAATARAVRAVDPQARVGGPACAGLNRKWIEALMKRCARDKLPLDFVEYHEYSGDLTELDRARVFVDAAAKAAGFRVPFPIVLGEFNWSGENLPRTGAARYSGGFWHLRAFGAAYTAAALVRAAELPGFELVVYSHTQYGDPRAGSWAATQLVGPRGEQWAPYNVLRGWKQAVGPEALRAEKDLPPGVYALASRDPATGRVGLVLVNHGFAQRKARMVHVSLRGLRPGGWRLRRWLVDPKHSSRWDVAEDQEGGKVHDELRMVEERVLEAEAHRPLGLDVELPAWGSTFLALEPTQ